MIYAGSRTNCAAVWKNCVCTRDFVPARTEYGFLPAGAAFSAEFDGQTLRVEYCEPVQFFRAVPYLNRWHDWCFALHRQPVFEHNGVMLDCSRNAVPRVEAVKMVLRKMALMGLNTLMLYTEDTYEVPEQPYFGYLRGRYSVEALRGLDSYAGRSGH